MSFAPFYWDLSSLFNKTAFHWYPDSNSILWIVLHIFYVIHFPYGKFFIPYYLYKTQNIVGDYYPFSRYRIAWFLHNEIVLPYLVKAKPSERLGRKATDPIPLLRQPGCRKVIRFFCVTFAHLYLQKPDSLALALGSPFLIWKSFQSNDYFK